MMEPVTQVEVKLGFEEARGMVLGWHDEADRKWGKPSFHNRKHIESTLEAAELAIRDNTDAFGFEEEVEKWNRGKPAEEIVTRQDLGEAMKWHWLLHDSGNILERLENGKPVYHAGVYKADGAEDRSKLVEAQLVPAKLLALVQHLTEATKRDADLAAPFARQVQLIDQVGSHVLRSDGDLALQGLLEEMKVERPGMQISPAYVVNFAYEKFRELVSGEKQQQKISRVWGDEKMPQRVMGVADKQVGLDEALQIIRDFAKLRREE